jgi:actin-related protein
MFESFNVKGIYVATDAVLSLLASEENDITTGICLHTTEGVTHAVPVDKGYLIPHAVQCLDIGGKDLTNYFMKILTERSYSITDKNVLNDMKKKLCYVPIDFEEEIKKSSYSSTLEKKYELPDGNVITIDTERFRCPEVLFKPSLIGLAQEGVHNILFESIKKCDTNLHKNLYSNIILSGDNSDFPGINERIVKEITSLAPRDMKIKLIAPPDRKISSWKGGLNLSSNSKFEQMWITRQEYDEIGPSIVHRKCF